MDRIYHMGSLVSDLGGVSPLCADKPRRLVLSRETWTIRPEGVTCPACKKLIVHPGYPGTVG